jgi:hypothetical protein
MESDEFLIDLNTNSMFLLRCPANGGTDKFSWIPAQMLKAGEGNSGDSGGSVVVMLMTVVQWSEW